MSNTQVGNVYAQIISDVIDSSRVDFEEGGVDEHVLEELRRGWEQKLSQLQVATFPWDPKIEPQPLSSVSTNLPPVPSNGANYAMSGPLPNSAPQPVPLPQPTNNHGDPRIKTEPGLESSVMGGMNQSSYQPSHSNLSGPQMAAQRAAANLTKSYGQRADASINAIHSNSNPQVVQQPSQQQIQSHQAMYNQQMRAQQNMQGMQAMQNMQARAGGMQAQPQSQSRIPMTQEEFHNRNMQQQQQQQARNQGGVNGAQTDGAGDVFDGPAVVIKRVNADGQEELGRLEVDSLIRDKIAAKGQAMEGGGLMLPLHQATDSKKRQRKVIKTTTGMPQTDGIGSDDDDTKDGVKDEEVDEDAINSDLDDPEDGLDDDEDDEDGMGHIMLCMYDKVQRVKNKWKCVMKDGVLTINGKEYVFHKAQGEYEW